MIKYLRIAIIPLAFLGTFLSPLAYSAALTAEFQFWDDSGKGDMNIRWMSDRYADGSDEIPVQTNDTIHLEYVKGPGWLCSNRIWHFRVNGGAWQTANGNVLELSYSSNTVVDVQLENNGWTNFFNCWRGNQVTFSDTYTFRFTPNMAQTRHPIMAVPGVLGYDEIELLGFEYFHNFDHEIEQHSYDNTFVTAEVGAWVDTEVRGAKLAGQIIEQVMAMDADNAFTNTYYAPRVNLVAHSHGGTTSRVAVKLIADLVDEMGFAGNPIASLSTIGTPHYGNPLAEGMMHIIQEWETIDEGATPVLGSENWTLLPPVSARGFIFDVTAQFFLGDFLGRAIDVFSGALTWEEFFNGEISDGAGLVAVLSDFTQRGMAQFNNCYPSAGLADGVQYHFTGQDYDRINPHTGTTYDYQDIEVENGEIPLNCNHWSLSRDNFYSENGLAGADGSLKRFTFNISEEMANENSTIRFEMSGGTGDADLYVKYGNAPDYSSYDCRPYRYGNVEYCGFNNPQAGTYHVMVDAWNAYSNVNLQVSSGEFEFEMDGTDQSTAPITLAATVNQAYGATQLDSTRAKVGDGLGNTLSEYDPKAIRYFSYTGVTEDIFTNMGDGKIEFPDVIDGGLLLINSMFAFSDGLKDDSVFDDWFNEVILKGRIHLSPNNPYYVPYTENLTDTFVPAPSARFGEYLGHITGWNHMDEVNGFAGLTNAQQADPRTVFLFHVNKLRNEGL